MLPIAPIASRQPFANHFNEDGTNASWARKSAAADDDIGSSDNSSSSSSSDTSDRERQRRGMRARVRRGVSKASEEVSKASQRVKKFIPGAGGLHLSSFGTGGAPIAGVLTDAAANAADLAAEQVERRRLRASTSQNFEAKARVEADAQVAVDAVSLAKTSVADAFHAANLALTVAEEEVRRARVELDNAKRDAAKGLAMAERAAAEAAERAGRATEAAVREAAKLEGLQKKEEEGEGRSPMKSSKGSDGESVPSQQLESSIVAEAADVDDRDDDDELLSGKWSNFNVSDLSYDDVDYTLTDMAPPFINEDECLVPGEPVVRVEKAPQNSRRIFAGIDIPVSVDDVWALLTDYPNLQKVVPNLVVNEVLELYSGSSEQHITIAVDDADTSLSAAEQCRTLAYNMKGAVLKQVGGAKVVGINFSARTKLEVREWPMGMPDFAHFEDEVFEGKTRSARVRESRRRELTRYVFPRPFALSSLPHRDISMQSVAEDDGEFRMYQGVWRMQPLPGCSPPGGSAMRLTYAVEVSPRPYLPVALVEGRIAQDLCSNLKAIREYFMVDRGEAKI